MDCPIRNVPADSHSALGAPRARTTALCVAPDLPYPLPVAGEDDRAINSNRRAGLWPAGVGVTSLRNTYNNVMMKDLTLWAPSLTAFAKWMEEENRAAAEIWSGRLKSSQSYQVESAVAEAVVWDYISNRSDSVWLEEIPGVGGVDFGFSVASNQFLVEVTNISSEAATDATKMPDRELFKGNYCLLTKNIRQKVRNKLGQARKRSDHPLLVAVTTLHENASSTCVDRRAVEFALGSPPRITWKWNPQTGESEGDAYQSTDLSQSVFLSPTPILGPDGDPIAQAKYQPISGFLFGGFGLNPKNVSVFGALNPEATNPFDPKLLPDIPFCSFKEWPVTASIDFTWTITEAEERAKSQKACEERLLAAGLGELVDEIRREAHKSENQ